jgi:hypothetical protein
MKKLNVPTINTSIKQVPALFNKISVAKDTTIINFGCGRYPELVEAKFKDNEVYSYDPLFDRDNENVYTDIYALYHTIGYLEMKAVIACANVLNVLEGDLLPLVIGQLKECLTGAQVLYISIYEGDKSGKGRATTKGYQRNQKTAEYMGLFEGYNVQRKGNILKITEIKEEG